MFSEDEYYAEFKKVRNRFRKFQYHELIKGCFRYLHAPPQSTQEYLERYPWRVLLFVKWLLIDDCYPNHGKKFASEDDLDELLQRSYNLVDATRMPNEYDHLTLFFRSVAYQQLPYQFDFGYGHLVRQSILFAGLDDNHLIKTKFKELTDVSVQDFLELSWILIFRFIKNAETTRRSTNWLGNLKGEYSPEVVKKYLNTVSVPIAEARRLLKKADDKKRKSIECYEFTSFVKFPLLQINNEYRVVEKHVLYRCIEHFIYDRLRQWDAARFMEKFGGMFERYAEHAIKKAGLKFSTEAEIRKELGEKGKQIDFIVHEADANILIDAKGVEMSYQGRVTHSASFLKDRTKSSILNAIRQAHDVIQKLDQTPECRIPSQKRNYLFVVTYKEFHLGNGRSYYEISAQEKMDEIYREYNSCPVISPENMYFITIDELDYVCAMFKKGGISISEMIDIAKEADKSPKTRKFSFIQHLRSMPETLEMPHYLVKEKERMLAKLKKILSK